MLRNKTILIISPQKWGNMVLSKQHYALELAKRGNAVYFLNPPSHGATLKSVVEIKRHKQFDVQQINYSTNKLMQVAKHKLRFVYDWWANIVIKRIIRQIGKSIDLVWCFDPMSFSNLDAFKANQIIYHPVDIHTTRFHQSLAKQADVVLSVAQLILDELTVDKSKMFHIHHGLSSAFITVHQNSPEASDADRPQCSYVGNLIRQDIDRATLENIVTTYPQVDFHFIGNYGKGNSNLDTTSLAAHEFITRLSQLKNVHLHGVMSTEELASFLQTMDLHLICYDPLLDMCKGTNYHKVIEYLSTGKAIVSNHVSTYKDMDLMYMCNSTADNEDFEDKFQYCITNLSHVNSAALQQKRIDFALSNTYAKQVDKIEKILTSLEPNE